MRKARCTPWRGNGGRAARVRPLARSAGVGNGRGRGRHTCSFDGCAVIRPFTASSGAPSFFRAGTFVFLLPGMWTFMPIFGAFIVHRLSNDINAGCGQPLQQRPINGTIDRRKGAPADLSRVMLEWIGHVVSTRSQPRFHDWPTQSASYHGTLLNTRVPRQASYD